VPVAYRLLLVDTNVDRLSELESELTRGGYHVAAASTFSEAKRRLSMAPPDLVITAVPLGEYNGLHLVVRARAAHPHVLAIVFHTADVVLEKEAQGMGAEYATDVSPIALHALVERLLSTVEAPVSTSVQRRWPRKYAHVTARIGDRDAEVVDASYGGLRLELSQVPADLSFSTSIVDIPHIGPITIHPVWARGGSDVAGRWWCGAEVGNTDEYTVDAWRSFVDSLS